MSGDNVRVLPAKWREAVLVCGKCSKKLHGGFGKDESRSLARALRRHLGVGRGRRAGLGVIETRCLDICPKGAVTVIRANRPDEWLVVPRATPIAQVAARLNLLPVE